MSIIQGNAHTSAGGGYQIERSLRFNSADSAYLNRTAGTPTNQIKWTFSGWIKRSTFGAYSTILSGGSTVNDYSWYGFDNNDKFSILHVIGGVNQGDNNSTSTMVFRDPSAWYHVVIVYDSANATAANRTILYVNGVQQTISAFPALNTSSSVNASGITQYIAQRGYSAIYNNGYLTEVNFIDGQALTPSSFGETDSATGVWKPKAYSGTYGTNGFELNFSDNSNNTAATLGKDSSGNGNNWTPNNFSVTAGSGNDSMVDSPTAYGTDTGVGGEVRGNYCTWNPTIAASTGVGTLSNGNLQCVTPTSGASNNYGTIGMSSGKWYWEITPTSISTTNSIVMIGIGNNTQSATEFYSQSGGYAYRGNGERWNNGSGVAYGSALSVNDVIGVAFDADARTIEFYRNGSSMGVAYSSIPAGEFFPGICDTGTTVTWTAVANFGQRAFAYTAPSGFKALCTTNLPTPTIGATSTTQANKYFDATLYTGTGSLQTITNSGSMQPDFFWSKGRSAANAHILIDAVRGATTFLSSNNTDADVTTTNGTLSSFNSNGVTLQADTNGYANFSGRTYVGWQWNAGGSNATNTSGTITSTVRANTTSGFSIVTGTAPASGAFTVGHGLGVAPSMIIIKDRQTSTGWPVYHASVTNQNEYLLLNTTAAKATLSGMFGANLPTSTVFGQTSGSAVTANNTFVAYCFAAVAGYSAFGGYTGNGSTDGPFVYTNFRPRFILWKRSDGAESWWINDTSRLGYNGANRALFPNASSAEDTANNIDILSNGFKIRGSGGEVNASGGTYIYMALAESPFKYSLGR